MKKKNTLFTVVLTLMQFVIFASLNAQTNCPGSLKHYWKLDESNPTVFEDFVGDLNINVIEATTAGVGIVDMAQVFAGSSELNIPDNISLDWRKDASFTIEFWLNKTTTCASLNSNGNNVVIGRDDANTQLHWWGGVSCTNPGKVHFSLFANDGSGRSVESKNGVIDGNWHLIAFVRDGTAKTTSIFIDGARDTTVSYTYTDGFSSLVPANVGWLNVGTQYHLDAKIDELALYDSALTETIFASHFNNGVGKAYCTEEDTTTTGIIDNMELGNKDFMVYPTHVTSELNIHLNINEAQQVLISMFDMTGRKITDMVNRHLNAGTHDLIFDMRSTVKTEINSMVLVRLQLKNSLTTRKVFLGIK